jgi:glutaredoxin
LHWRIENPRVGGSAPPDQPTASARPRQDVDFEQALRPNPIPVSGITASLAGNSDTVVRRVEVCWTNETAPVWALCARSPGAPDQKELAVKKLIFLALLGLTLENWDHIDRFVFDRPDYSTARNKVFLYATESCGACQKTRVLFRENNISYVEYDIEKSERRLKEFQRLGGIGVPLLRINGKVIHGYRPELILASLRSN